MITLEIFDPRQFYQEANLSRQARRQHRQRHIDRKSTRLNSSHGYISYAVFCLKKKTKPHPSPPQKYRAKASPTPRETSAQRGALSLPMAATLARLVDGRETLPHAITDPCDAHL